MPSYTTRAGGGMGRSSPAGPSRAAAPAAAPAAAAFGRSRSAYTSRPAASQESRCDISATPEGLQFTLAEGEQAHVSQNEAGETVVTVTGPAEAESGEAEPEVKPEPRRPEVTPAD